MGEPTRREPRHPIALPVVLVVGGRRIDCSTRDISFAGAFLETPSVAGRDDARAAERPDPLGTLKAGQLIRVNIFLPNGTPFEASAVVVHVARMRTHSGLGIRFFGLGRSAQEDWDRVVVDIRDLPKPDLWQRTYSDGPPSHSRAVRLPRGEHFEPLLYRSAHQVAVLRVYVGSVVDLYALSEPQRDKTFIQTDERLSVGDEVGLQWVHPNSEDIFEMSAFVTRVVDQHDMRGAEVEILDLDTERRARFAEFIDDGLESLFDDVDLEADTHTG
ncbi:MAG: PilZ domain-containing protein [Polyangiaceae bacterium]